jgi:hypothetical protein
MDEYGLSFDHEFADRPRRFELVPTALSDLPAPGPKEVGDGLHRRRRRNAHEEV